MDDLFNSIKDSYNSLWHVKVLGESLEIVTPMVTTNDIFVSVFITKRGDDYIVTDGGWIAAGYYDCTLGVIGKAYNKLFQYYLENYHILQTVGHGRTMFYKRISDKYLVVNAVFELSNFISAVVSGTNIQFQTDKKEARFKSSVRKYLTEVFEPEAFLFNQRLANNSTIEYGAVSHFANHTQLINLVTGSNASYYRDSLCRSNFYFEASHIYSEQLNINKRVALLDDTSPSVFNSPQVRELIELSQQISGNILLPWSEKNGLRTVLVA